MIVFDASALLTLLKGEAGARIVEQAAAEDDVSISAVNYSEALQKAQHHGVSPEEVDAALDDLGVAVIHFGPLDARLTASFYRHRSGLSLADRVCLALARSLASPAYTADRAWADWADDLGVAVHVIR